MMTTRTPLSCIFMSTAQLFAERSTCVRKKVGAVLVFNNRIISTGYVGAPPGQPHCIDIGCDIGSNNGCIRTVHAEANTILFAAKNGIITKDTTLFTTLSPCIDCAKMIITAGITTVFYFEEYRDTSPIAMLKASNIRVFHLVYNSTTWNIQ